MFASLRGRTGLVLLAFFLLVSISVAMTFWTIETLKNDALVINLADRQRLLIKQMTDDVLRLANREGVDHLAALEEASGTFDRILKALRYGGLAPYYYFVRIGVSKVP